MGVIKRNASNKKYTTGSNSGGLSTSARPKAAISFRAPVSSQQYKGSGGYVSSEPGAGSYRGARSTGSAKILPPWDDIGGNRSNENVQPSYGISGNGNNGNNGNAPSFYRSAETQRYNQKLRRAEKGRPDKFSASDMTNGYLQRLKDTENRKPEDFQSKYTQNIADLLDTIQNPQAFDLKSNDTYKQLYDNYRESYMAQGDRAMRDAQGAAAAMTGGYGSTYAMAAGQQAYDSYLQRLNDNNINLYQMALNDYWQNRNDKYNQLNAVNGQDAVDYKRYRDAVGDWKDDRSYYAGQYQQNYANDYGRYRDEVGDWQTDRAYYAGQAQNSYSNDFNMYQSGLDQYNAELNRRQAQSQFEAQQALQREQDAQAQKNWQTEWDYRLAQDALRAQQEAAGGGSGGGRSGGRRSGRRRSGKSASRGTDGLSPLTRSEYEKTYDEILNGYDDGEKMAKAYEEYIRSNGGVKTGRSFTRSDGKQVDINLFNSALDTRNYLQEERAGTNVYRFPNGYEDSETRSLPSAKARERAYQYDKAKSSGKQRKKK